MTDPLLWTLIAGAFCGTLALACFKVLASWERAIVLRLGRFHRMMGPGPVLLLPFIDRAYRVDTRIVTLEVPRQDMMTRDNVPVSVDAIVLFYVVDPRAAILNIENYIRTTSLIAQTTLRSTIGQAELDDLLSHRDRINQHLQTVIDTQTEPYGVKVTAVEVRDVSLPETMMRAMAAQAEAEREKRAKIINAEGEFQASERLAQAAATMRREPGAMQLRYLQSMREIASERSSMTILPIPIDLLTPFVDAAKRYAAEPAVRADDPPQELATGAAETAALPPPASSTASGLPPAPPRQDSGVLEEVDRSVTEHMHVATEQRRVVPSPALFLALALLIPQAAFPAPTGRERIRFDAGWRFHLEKPGDADGGTGISTWRWRAVSLPGNSIPERAETALEPDASWQEARPGQDTFHGRRGFAWFVTSLPDVQGAHRSIHFESVDDNATVYLNGRKLLSHEGWSEPFDVPLDAAWNPGGKNLLTVLVENTDGAGGIGPASLHAGAEEIAAPARLQFDDSRWRVIHLPHDFVVEGAFDSRAPAGHGSLPTGVGWYRKSFALPASDRGRSLWIDFDGIYRDSKVWLNGKLLKHHKSGYIGFRCDITESARYGSRNTLVVRADARALEGWWYEGGGIYRHVWLNKADPLHIAPWSLFVLPQVRANGPSEARVQMTLDNTAARQETCRVIAELRAASGTKVAEAAAEVALTPKASREVTLTLSVPDPKLWSLETPTLYRLVTSVYRAGRVIDSDSAPCGFRTVRFDPDRGLFVNGRPVKIKGTCNHQDFAGVGIALPDSLHLWRIKKLKEMGSNAYRCSHNPPAPELLDACDRLGMLVMDENRHLGDTYRDHSPRGTPFSDLSDLRAMVRRDRNHPSIILWSMCNEEGLQGSDEGARIFSAMKKAVLELDPSRPLSCAMNGGWGQGISLVQDLQGCNYNPAGYDGFHKMFPAQPVYGSETASAVSTRGEYVNDRVRGYVSAYDVNAPPWAQTAEVAWRALAERSFMAGGFVWTGFDYKGEPTPYGWPCINSHFGIMDMCGFPKDTYYYYKSWWGDGDIVHLLPHWNWPGKEGQQIEVWCHSNCERVELFLNGASLGSKEIPRYGHAEWRVSYAPGKLEARGYRNGRLAATDIVETTGPATRIELLADRSEMLADGEDMVPVWISLLDAQGRIVPFADNEVTFTVGGAGQIAGVGNGDPSSHEPDRAAKRHAFHGRLMALVQAAERPGTITLSVAAPGLQSARMEFRTAP